MINQSQRVLCIIVTIVSIGIIHWIYVPLELYMDNPTESQYQDKIDHLHMVSQSTTIIIKKKIKIKDCTGPLRNPLHRVKSFPIISAVT